ncbi:MAG: PGF-CTERM protein [Natronomonas sp.]|jgi:PGF-CTERM protein
MSSCSRAVVALVIATLAVSLFAGVGAAQEPEPVDGRFLVELDADGDAQISLEQEYNLSNDAERDAFESIHNDSAARREAAEQVQQDTEYVNNVADDETDREMVVGEVSVETSVDGDVGTVAYRFTWENLAATEEGRLILAEPFSLYDELDRKLVVVVPEEYEITSATPEPDEQNATSASWAGFTSFSDPEGGFEVVAESEDASSGDGAGFGPAVAVGALLAAALLAHRRR